MTTFGNRVRSTLGTVVLATAASGFLAACGAGEDQQAYCADEDGNVVDEDRCDDDGRDGGGLFFLYVGGFGGHSYGPGDRIPREYRSGSGAATRIRPGDGAARERAGLSRSGKVSNGQRVSGGIGSGSGKVGGSAGG